MDFFYVPVITPHEKDERRSVAAVTIQSTWRMVIYRKLYMKTLSIKQREKKRLFSDIEENSKLATNQVRIERHEFMKLSRAIIFKNFPGISLENERVIGKFPNDFITIKSKADCIGRTCPLSMRQHSKNSTYFVIDANARSVCVECFKCSAELGSKKLNMETTVLEDILPNLTISEKSESKPKKIKYHELEPLNEIQIVNFDHIVIHADESTIIELLDLLRITRVPARLDKKAPTFSSWNKRCFEDNEQIDFRYNNMAIVTGRASNVFVLDVDINDGGLEYFQRLCTKHNYRYDNETMSVLTPSGGVHLYFKYCESFSGNTVRMRTTGGDPIGIDIRSNNGCVISPPSSYANGKYQYLCMKKPQDCPDFIRALVPE